MIDVHEEKPQSFTITRDQICSIVREAWAAGNASRWMQSEWGKAQGSQEMLTRVLTRFEGKLS